MKKNPLVSVNITTYNRPKLLIRSLNSVLNQSYKEIEIIIVNDGSNISYEKINKFLKYNKQIRYIKHKINKGNAIARNTAFKNSKGKYIAFMDDDDEWIDKDKIKKQVCLFEKKEILNLAIIATSVNLIKPNNNVIKKEIKNINCKYKILGSNGIIYSPTVMTRKKDLKLTNGFDINLKRGVDSEFYRTCMLKHNLNIYIMNEITTNIYENRYDRITLKNNSKSLYNQINANLYLIKKYNKLYLDNPFALYKRMKNILISIFKILILKIMKNEK